MKILITGATGFTGSHLTYRLLSMGHDVWCLARTTSKYHNLEKAGAKMIFGDIRDKTSIQNAFAGGIDIVFNIAAIFRTWGLPDSVYYDTHVEGTRNLIEACPQNKVKRYIHCSTTGVHGALKNIPGTEESPFNPGDIYQRTKLEAERLVLDYYKKHGLPAVIIRPAGIYGPGDMRFLKLFRSISRKNFIMIGSGKTMWHPIYIDDLTASFLLAMNIPNIEGEVFIIGGPEYVTINNLTAIIADSVNAPYPRFNLPAKPVQIAGTLCELICRPFSISPPLFRSRVDFFVKDRAFNISKAKRLLGYVPKYDIIEGIKLTAEWYKENNLL